MTPRLEREEVEHYRWLIDALLYGAIRMTEKPTVHIALVEARELFTDLMVRVEEEVKR